jgi:hypothetical protein
MRYNTTDKTNDINGKRRKLTTILPVVPTSTSDIQIITTSVERLDKLANTFYGDASLWWIIATANSLGKGTIIVPVDTVLRIPSKNKIDDIIIQTNITR